MESHLIIQSCRGRLGLGIELSAQNRLTQLILPQCLSPLAATDVAPHGDPVTIFTARILSKQV
jgi:hypothetical protein